MVVVWMEGGDRWIPPHWQTPPTLKTTVPFMILSKDYHLQSERLCPDHVSWTQQVALEAKNDQVMKV